MSVGNAPKGGGAAITLNPYQGLKQILALFCEGLGGIAAITLNPYQGLKLGAGIPGTPIEAPQLH